MRQWSWMWLVVILLGCHRPATAPPDPSQGNPSVGQGGPDAVRPPPDRVPKK